MNELSRKQATTKVCPFKRTNPRIMCIADDCMSWEWTDFVKSHEQQVVKYPTDENGNNRKIESFTTNKPYRGVCRLIFKKEG